MLKSFFSISTTLNSRLRCSLIFLLFLVCFTSMIEVISIYSFGTSISYLTNGTPTIFSRIGVSDKAFLAFSGISILLSGFFMSYTLYFRAKVSFQIGGYFSKLVFKNKVHNNINKIKLSEIINDVTYETDRFARSFISELLQFLARVFISLVLTAYIVFLISEKLFLFVVLIVFIYFIIAYSLRVKIRETGKLITLKNEARYQLVKNGYLGIRDFRVLNKYDFIFEKFSNVVDVFNSANAKVQYFSLIPRYAMESIVLVIILLSMAYGSGDGTLSSLDIGLVSSSFLAILKLLPQISQAYQAMSNLLANKSALDRLYLSLKNVDSNSINTSRSCYQSPTPVSSITLRDVVYSYDDNLVLDKLSFVFKSGEINYIIGPSGSGKSTLLDIICGFKEPLRGSVQCLVPELVDGPISYTSQQPFNFDGSIRDNLTLGDSGISDEQCWSALEAVDLADLVSFQSEKLETIIGESGMSLSGGQAQRLSIARAICFDRQIQIYDEPTSALDSVTSTLVIDNLRKIAKTKLVIVVTHNNTHIRCSNYLELAKK